MPRKFRLKEKSDFQRVLSKGKRNRSETLTLAYIQSPENQSNSRVGVVVSTKDEKRAVLRNRLKRRIKSIVAGVIPGFESAGFDVVFLTSAKSYTKTFEELKAEVRDLLVSSKILNDIQRYNGSGDE